MWYVYIIRCSDKTLYTGITNNLKNRIKNHNDGKGARYTRGRTPVKLAYKEMFRSRSTASKRESQIKKLSRKEKSVLVRS